MPSGDPYSAKEGGGQNDDEEEDGGETGGARRASEQRENQTQKLFSGEGLKTESRSIAS